MSSNFCAAKRRMIVVAAIALLGASVVPRPVGAAVDYVAVIQNFVRVGVDNAASDFVGLRGARLADGPNAATNYKVTKFPLGGCKVSKGTSADLTCYLPVYRMSKKALLDLLAPVIQDALPAGFSESTDALDLIANNMLWKRTSDHISVGVYCLYFDKTHTTLDCVISVSHNAAI